MAIKLKMPLSLGRDTTRDGISERIIKNTTDKPGHFSCGPIAVSKKLRLLSSWQNFFKFSRSRFFRVKLLLKKSGFSVIERRINLYRVLKASPKDSYDRGVPKRIIKALLFGFTGVISDEVPVVYKKRRVYNTQIDSF
jgi:hypothetical protein